MEKPQKKPRIPNRKPKRKKAVKYCIPPSAGRFYLCCPACSRLIVGRVLKPTVKDGFMSAVSACSCGAIAVITVAL